MPCHSFLVLRFINHLELDETRITALPLILIWVGFYSQKRFILVRNAFARVPTVQKRAD
jgi:hypothetical protein